MSQPQTWILGQAQDAAAPGALTPVSGGYDGQSDVGRRCFFYGETGRERVTTNLAKLKLGYEAGEWLGRFTLAFEDRRRDSEEVESYMRDSLTGKPVYRGAAVQGGRSFTVSPSGFSESINDRESLLLGGALDEPLGADWRLEFDWSAFEELRDDTRQGATIWVWWSAPRGATGSSGLLPKFSLGFAPLEGWQFRYSIARAVRFPVVDELLRNVSGIRSTQFADATLEPERGLHHDLTIERQLANGYLRADLFRERVRDVIYSQTLPGASGTTQTLVLPLDAELVSGAELIAQLGGLWGGKLDLRANLTYTLTYTRAKIIENSRQPAFQGNEFPRMPRWRGNALLTYHWSDRLDTSPGRLRYSGDSYNRLDDRDSGHEYYGSVDAHRFVELRIGYRLSEQTRLSFGIDDVFDERSFVGHPWPGRTLYAELDWSM